MRNGEQLLVEIAPLLIGLLLGHCALHLFHLGENLCFGGAERCQHHRGAFGPAMREQPARALWQEEDAGCLDCGRDCSQSQHPTPGARHVRKDRVHTVRYKGTRTDQEYVHRNQTATEVNGCTFGNVHGHSRRRGTNPQSDQNAANDQKPHCWSHCHQNRACHKAATAQQGGSASAQTSVHGCCADRTNDRTKDRSRHDHLLHGIVEAELVANEQHRTRDHASVKAKQKAANAREDCQQNHLGRILEKARERRWEFTVTLVQTGELLHLHTMRVRTLLLLSDHLQTALLDALFLAESAIIRTVCIHHWNSPL
mmetsp:Transcript_37786/g.94982  ORF Transcript_37786/g.94982 Transcript_37786/m.94982 type:complete len:312 (+) Transcript_37786:1022-1957(+)